MAKYFTGEFAKLTQDYLTFKKGEIVVISEIRDPRTSNYDYKVNKTNVDSYGFLNEGVLEVPSDEDVLKAMKDIRKLHEIKENKRSKNESHRQIARSVDHYDGHRSINKESSRSYTNNNDNLIETIIQLDNISTFCE